MNSKYIYKVFIAGMLLFTPIAIIAQGFSPAALEWQKEQRLWLQSNNAAGMVFDDTRNYSDVVIGYHVKDGNYKRPQQGEKDKNLSVSSEGFMNLQKVFVWGKFSFNHQNLQDAQYNASITDPFRGMPFYVADTNKSKWRNQFYNMTFRVGTPLYFNHLTFGLEGTYKTTLAAKQRDPRVDTRFYNLQLKPGVTYSVNNAHHIGLNAYYSSIKEDSRMRNENSYVNQDYYILYGLGVASHGVGSGITANYFGNLWGLGMQYQYSQGPWNLLFEAIYDKKIENVEQSYSSPKKLGAVNDKHVALSTTVLYKGGHFTHELKSGCDYHHIGGTQYLMKRDNTENYSGWIELTHFVRSLYQTRSAYFKYGIIKNKDDEYDWRADVQVGYLNYDDKYILPESKKDSKILTVQADVKKNFRLDDRMNRRLLATLTGGFRNGMNGNYIYGGTNSDYPTVKEMEPLDEAYLKSDSWNIGTSLIYSQLIKPEARMNIYAKAQLNYTKSKTDLFNKRKELSLAIGCNF
ncbi:MAG: DUF6850 family outer membrane beta-barrel protein [Phocaeicola sp.]|uniref:DUF6850 family outer membrane beta-barrel protein n=1 Tax=Phocaeicola sp. TaxID=2773926 RepID=UPI003F9F700F